MNKFLLDTHILLWSLLEPDRLHHKIVEALEDNENEKWLSPITTWEIIDLEDKGRIRLDDNPVSWMKNVFKILPFKEAVLNHEVAMQSTVVNLPHKDPADRFLVASAVVYGLTLITADKKIINSIDSSLKLFQM